MNQPELPFDPPLSHEEEQVEEQLQQQGVDPAHLAADAMRRGLEQLEAENAVEPGCMDRLYEGYFGRKRGS